MTGTVTFADGGQWDTARRTHILGIVNVTPDSFSDGALYLDPARAAEHACRLAEEGADAVDIGGESTRPGAEPVSAEEEHRRVIPALRRVRQEAPSLRISVDTTRAALAREALDEGADMVNDISAFTADRAMAGVVAAAGAACILMHRRGTPATMQDDPRYGDVVDEIGVALNRALRDAIAEGVPEGGIVLDPGLGFGKTLEHNHEILRRLGELTRLGRPLAVGASRKSFVVTLCDLQEAPVPARLEGSLGAAAAAILGGASVLRVHDVAATLRMARVVDAIVRPARRLRAGAGAASVAGEAGGRPGGPRCS